MSDKEIPEATELAILIFEEIGLYGASDKAAAVADKYYAEPQNNVLADKLESMEQLIVNTIASLRSENFNIIAGTIERIYKEKGGTK